MAQPHEAPAYKDPRKTVAERVEDLLSRMTLEEKVAQLVCVSRDFDFGASQFKGGGEGLSREVVSKGLGQIAIGSHRKRPRENAEYCNAIQQRFREESRLGIPVIVHEEGLHGHMAPEGTSFPSPIAMASTWNPELIRKTYGHIAEEIRIRGGHLVLTPNLDLAREPRWGRVEETYGEDPFLAGEMGVAAVKGFQGDFHGKGFDQRHVASTVKHYLAHGSPENGINISPPAADEWTIRNILLEPFRRAIVEAKAQGVMAAYSEIDGEPVHGSRRWLTDVLRGELGFEGIVVSDWFGIQHLNEFHFTTENEKESGGQCINAGCDCEIPQQNCYAHLPELLQEGKVSMETVDQSVRRVLRLKFLLGLFENPCTDPEQVERVVASPAKLAHAQAVAEEAFTLLKNEGGALPLDRRRVRRIALVGPNAAVCQLGNYTSANARKVSPLDGLREFLGNDAELISHPGVQLVDSRQTREDMHAIILAGDAENRASITEAVELAKDADVIVLCLGGTNTLQREGWASYHSGDNSSLELRCLQNELAERMKALGKPVIALVFSGGPYVLTRLSATVDALAQCWYLGEATGHALARILFGEANPSGKLPVSLPRSTGQIPVFYNHKAYARQRGYLFESTLPLYPFGHGLSYSRFEYGKPWLERESIGRGEATTLTVEVRNTGPVEGMETVQLYIRDCVASVTRPVKELKGFRKIRLQPGQARTVTFEITERELGFHDRQSNWVVEAGSFEILVGSSSVVAQSLHLKYLKGSAWSCHCADSLTP